MEEESDAEESDLEESDESAAKIAVPSSIKDAKAQSKRKPPDINTSCGTAGSQTAQPARNRALLGEWESQPKSVSEVMTHSSVVFSEAKPGCYDGTR